MDSLPEHGARVGPQRKRRGCCQTTGTNQASLQVSEGPRREPGVGGQAVKG